MLEEIIVAGFGGQVFYHWHDLGLCAAMIEDKEIT